MPHLGPMEHSRMMEMRYLTAMVCREGRAIKVAMVRRRMRHPERRHPPRKACPHPTMPNFVLTPDETANLIAYIFSLRKSTGKAEQ